MLLFTESKRNPLYAQLLATGQFVDAQSVAPLEYSPEGYYARDKQLMKNEKKTLILADYVYDSTLKLIRYTASYNEYMRDFFLSDIAPQHKTMQSVVRAWNGFKDKCLLTTKIVLKDGTSYIIRDWEDYNFLISKPHYAFARDIYDPEDAKYHRRSEVTSTYVSELDLYRQEQSKLQRLENRFLQLDDLLLAGGCKIKARQMYIMLLDSEDYRTHITEMLSTWDPREMKWIDQSDPCNIIQAYAMMKFNIKQDIDVDPIVPGLDSRLYAERVLNVPYEQLDKYNTFQGDAMDWDTVNYMAYFGRPMASKAGQNWGGDE